MENQRTFHPLTASCLAHGWKDIGAAFGVSPRIVRQWANEGAPVVMVTPSTPCVSLGELWEWLKGRERNQPSPLPENVDGEQYAHAHARRETWKGESEEAEGGKINLKGRECPYCASVGTLRRHGEKYRCEWCRQSFTRDELGES